MTAWRRAILATLRATRAGSSGSFHVGLPVLTLQKPRRRVQVSLRIMNVAVPRCQPSPMFGQDASWRTVRRISASMRGGRPRQHGLSGAGTLNQRGLRARIDRTSGPSTLSTSMPPGFALVRVLCSRASTGSHDTTRRPVLPAATPPPPPIVRHYIPYPAKRKREMRAYARRHYGVDSYRLTDPKVIVEHVAVAGSTNSVYATFAPDVPDIELHELPGICSHFVVGSDGTVVQLVPLSLMCRHTVGLNYTAIG